MRSKPGLFLILSSLVAIGINSVALAVDGGAGYENGAHNQKAAGLRGPVCTGCHFSKSGKGEKIWTDLPLGAQTLPRAVGAKQGSTVAVVCSSCHYPGNAVNARSGFILGQHESHGHDFAHGNVLVDTSLLGIGESHVMSGQAEPDPEIGKLRTALDDGTFPLRDADRQGQDNQGQAKGGLSEEAQRHRGTEAQRKEKDSGFTCTTCHDPHSQPNLDISGSGDYLRTKEEKLVGQSNQRTDFCLQCHEDTPTTPGPLPLPLSPGQGSPVAGKGQQGSPVAGEGRSFVQHGVSAGCNQCHHPHDGYYQLKRQAQLGRSILTQRINPVNFQALPNVVGFGPTQEHGRAGDWESGRAGEWESGRAGEWESGREKVTNSLQPTAYSRPYPSQESESDVSAFCYSCHGPTATQAMRDAGAKPIFGSGSDPAHLRTHHPMGSRAELGRALRAPGLKNAALNRYDQVTCTSCHNGFHRGKNVHFLRADFSQDSSSLCTFCHTDKRAKDLGIRGAAHRQICGQSPNKRGECMFCHFIHDGPDRTEQQKPSTRALLRIDPVNLAWSDQSGDTDTDDFEDLCFGCHSSQNYMKGTGKQGAGLQPQKYFSHRFSSIPSDRVHPTLPVSDADLGRVVDDYGVEKGKIYCGSCHDVHHSANAPYLRGKDSPYAGAGFCARCHTEYPANGKSSHPVAVSARPGITVDELPPFAYGGKSGVCRGITSNEGPKGQVLCLTCHSIHAAQTNFDGRIDLGKEEAQRHRGGGCAQTYAQSKEEESTAGADGKSANSLQPTACSLQPALNETMPSQAGDLLPRHGKLLVLDNFSSAQGSDLCLSCHPSHRGIVGSRHDFSAMNLGAGSPCGTPLSFGTCSACHIPHGSQEKTFLWTRSLAQERRAFGQHERPNYQKGVTLLCYDCHDDHNCADDDPPLSSFLHAPLDIAFSGGPGKTSKVGFYETIPPGGLGENGVQDPPVNGSETGGHYVKTACLSEITNGIDTGDKLPCDICHDPHKTSNNEAFLRNPLGVNSSAHLKASRNSTYGTGTGREICASCHGYSETHLPINTPVRLFGVEIVKPPDKFVDSRSYGISDYGFHSESDRKTPCTQCHVHNRMAAPKSASSGASTHGFHFTSLLSDGESNIMGGRSVMTEISSDDRSCAVCHSPELIFQAGKLVFKDGQTLAQTTVCDTCHSRGGQYDGVNGYSPIVSSFDHGAKDSWGEGVYEEVIDEKGNSDWQLRTGKEAWCLGCHDDQPSRIQNPDLEEQLWVQGPNVAGDTGRTYGFEVSGHGVSKSALYQQSGKAGAGLACTACHSPVARHIVNSQREKKANFKNWQANEFRLKLNMELPRRSEEFRISDFELCLSCHEQGSVLGLPPGYWDYTDDYNPYVNLNTHDYPMTRFSNADRLGIYPLKRMGQSITVDFNKLFPNHSYNLHWNHLSLPNVDINPDAIITPQAQSSSSSSRRTQTCYSGRCHAGTSVVKARPSSFWDSDRDGILDSRPSCTACHNPHGSSYLSMTRDDLAITHTGSLDGEYGMIGSKEYGAYDDTLDNYNDLYCWECHAKLQRSGSSYTYYPQPVTKDRMAPEPPQ